LGGAAPRSSSDDPGSSEEEEELGRSFCLHRHKAPTRGEGVIIGDDW